MAMKKWFLPALVLVCGLAARSSAQLVGINDKIFVLKGAGAYTLNYVYDASKDTSAKPDLNVALELDRVIAVKPKLYFYLVCSADYEPSSYFKGAVETWTGDGKVDVWPLGLVVYGVGRHTAAGLWDAKAVYSYDAGIFGVDFNFREINPPALDAWTAKGKRAGTGYIDGRDTQLANLIEYNDYTSGSGLATLACTTKKMATKVPVATWYEPSALTIELSGIQMQDLITLNADGTADSFVPTQFGLLKVKFTTDATLTKLANTVGNTQAANLGLVSDAIDAALVKGKYQPVGAEF